MRYFVILLLFPLILIIGQTDVHAEATAGPGASPSDTLGEAIISDREKVQLVEDSNLAEAMDRRPDLDFANVTIDGEKTTISLEDIPADQVESAEVSKSITPDLDADLRGGGLNLRSKPSYALDERVIQGSVLTGYNSVAGGYKTEANLTYGRPMGRWGFMLTTSTNQGLEGEEDYRQDWGRLDESPEGLFVLEDQRIEYFEMDTAGYKINGTVDFKVSEDIRLYVKGDYEQSDKVGIKPLLLIRYTDGEYRDVTAEGADVQGATVERYLTGWESEATKSSIRTGGYLDFEAVSMDYQFSLSDSQYLEPDWFVAKFDQENLNLTYDLENDLAPAFGVLPDSVGGLNDPASFKNEWISRNRWEQNQKVLLSTANVKFPVEFLGAEGYFKTGIKLRGLDFTQDSRTDFYDQIDGQFTLADVSSAYSNNGILGGAYQHGPFPSTSATRKFLDDNPDRFVRNVTRSREESDPVTYGANEDIHAGYALLFLNMNQLRVIAGLRYEETDLVYQANELILDQEGGYFSTNNLTDSNSYANWFPGIHGRYDWNRFSFVGSWSNTIQRPQFGRIVPFRQVNRESESIATGNPGLQPTLFTNYDISIDYRLSEVDQISLELFYQTVEDIVYREVTIVADGVYEGYQLETDQNGPSGKIYGFRLIWSQDLGALGTFAEGFSLGMKYIYQISETVYPGRPGFTLPMPERPENEMEISLSYQRARFFAQLDFVYEQSNLEQINDDEVWRDQYSSDRVQIDFSGSYEVVDGIRLLFEISNLTNELEGKDVYGNGLMVDYGYSPRMYKLGFRFDL